MKGKIKGLGRKGHVVNRLLFVDDVMLFSRAAPNYVRQIEKVLEAFNSFSSLKLNIMKCKIIYRKGVPLVVRKKYKFQGRFSSYKILGGSLALQET